MILDKNGYWIYDYPNTGEIADEYAVNFKNAISMGQHKLILDFEGKMFAYYSEQIEINNDEFEILDKLLRQ